MPFTKLHNCILNSSIWNEPNHVRIAWITMLAMADEEGRVKASLGGLAHQARLSLDDTTAAVTVLESPDTDSSRKDHDGRRVERTDGGWIVLNHGYYRELGMSDATREYWRKKQAERRMSRTVKDSQGQSRKHASASASESVTEEDKDSGPSIAPPPPAAVPTLAEVRAYASSPACGFRADRVEEWFHDCEATEWRYARNWQAALRRDRCKERWMKPAHTTARKGPNI